MNDTRALRLILPAIAGALINAGATPSLAENIDPEKNGSRYAWAENVGWLNAEPSGNGGPGVQVDDFGLSGWMWGENTGWVSLSCANTDSCASADYGVTNDNCGKLTGYAWAENLGWVNFSPATAGVLIDPQTGDFSGSAWGENIGWITFADDWPVAYGVSTGWRRYAPTTGPGIELAKDAGELVISWSTVADSDGYDVFQGSLTNLLTSGGDFATSTYDCLAEDQAATSHQQSSSVGTARDFFLVRAVNCGGNGSSDSGGPAQAGGRDGEIAASGTCQ